MFAQDPGGEKELLAPRIPGGHFFLASFCPVSLDGLSERETTRSLGIRALAQGYNSRILALYLLGCTRRNKIIGNALTSVFWIDFRRSTRAGFSPKELLL